MSLWARAWGTIALVIVVAGGAVGIVTSLRARTIGAAQQAHGDGWQAASAAQGAPEKRTEAMDAIRAPSAPAAAPGIAAPAPVVPSPAASRSGASSADAVTAAPVGSSADSVGPRAPPSAVVFRTTDSLAVSPPVGSATALSLARRNKPAVETTTQPKTEPGPPLEEPAHQPAPAPAASDAPATTDESEAWVTEERRF